MKTNGPRAIDLKYVEKIYRKRVHALRGIAMQVEPGEIFGLLGPNGAGKSTLVKIMTTIVRPTRAEGTLLGQPLGHKEIFSRIGYLPEHHQLPPYLTGRQLLEFFAALSKVDRATRRRRIPELLEMVGMAEWADTKVSEYSKGMQQRIGLAQAMVNEPELLLLDEPTDGVDPVGRREFRDVITNLRDRGKTILINSHILSELEMVCQRVAILIAGQITEQGTIDELTAESVRYEIVIQGEPPAWAQQDQRMRCETLPQSRCRLNLPGATADQVQPIIDRLRNEQVLVESMQPKRESLEDLFMRTVTKAAPVAAEVVAAPDQQ